MAKTFTAAQEAAINEQSKTLLVSAAAGSGKTTTLIERIIRSVTRKETPLMLDRMLIVTFTKATASELRLRISSALSNAIAESGGDELLAKQMALLPSAKISTIDSFCLDIVRSNFSPLGLSPNFRMADDGESALIAEETMEHLINECYDNKESRICGGPLGFASLVDTLLGASDDKRLSEILISLYKKLEAFPEGASALYKREAELREYAEHDFFDCEHGKRIESYLLSFFEYYKKGYMHCLDLISRNEALAKVYTPYYEEDLHNIFAIERAIKESYETGRAAIDALTFTGIKGGYRGEKDDNFFFVKEFRTSFKTDVTKKIPKYISADSEGVRNALIETANICHSLAEILCEYEKRAEAEKKRRGVCDFSDISRYTLRLLVNKDGSDSEFALSQKELYDAVYIDEYQDVNAVQDRIFEAISTKNNRFMVGDIKQSIYGFRGAEPAIFAKLRHEFPPLDKAEGSDKATVFMSENFRCNKEVIDFTNLIFDKLMPLVSPNMNYTPSDSLVFKKNCESGTPTPVQIVITEAPPKDAPDADRHTEAEFIRDEIKRLVKEERKDNGEPFRYGDIAILLRSRRYLGAYANALKDANIPVYTETDDDLLLQSEVMIVRCMLEAIDNPRRDIALCGAMLSPLCNLDCNFVAGLRKNTKGERLITTLRNYLEKADDSEEKLAAEHFYKELCEFRSMARFMSAGELIDEFYTRYAVYARLGASNEMRRANLDKFKEIAYTFGAESKNLCEFLRYLGGVDSNPNAMLKAARPALDSADAVQIITAHKSKGLEFPAVFFADTTKLYNRTDASQSPIYSGNAGFGVKLRDESGFCVCDTLLRKSISLAVTQANAEEELRLLYVALTRARERLYVTAMHQDPSGLIADCKNLSKILTAFTAAKQTTHLELVLLALGDEDIPYANIKTIDYMPQSDTCDTAIENEEAEAVANAETEALLSKRFGYRYPHEARTKIPAKFAISRLYPDILDDTVENEGLELKKQATPKKAPRFIAKDENDGAKRGTATHLFMQFFDFENAAQNGVCAEISRLTEKGFITNEDASLVNTDEVNTFIKSSLFAEMRSATRIYREQRFNLTLSAADFAQDDSLKNELFGETVLVQGVIDCFFYNENGEIILVDYKTDRLPCDREIAVQKLRDTHTAQLKYYARAVEEICGKAPKSTLIYSLCLGDIVEV